MTATAQGRHSDIWDPREKWSREQLRAHQLEKLRAQLARLASGNGFYADRFRKLGFAPGDLTKLEDLSKLPVTLKADYAAAQIDGSLFNSFTVASPDEVTRVHFSSGTTGKPTPQFWTQADLDRWADLYARYAYAIGVRKSDIFQCLFGFAWFVGGLGATAGLQRIGATCIPSGNQDTDRQIATIFDCGSTVLFGTPSFITHLAAEMERRGLDAAQSQVRLIVVGGEVGASVPATRHRIERLWNAKCFDAYGCLEFQPVAAECSEQNGLHLFEDFLCAEIVDAETGAPVADDTPGVLVLTHLDKQAGPLVRWWTGDTVVRDSRPCLCGRTHARLIGGIQGRADDMLVVRGVNVFPSAVEGVVRSIGGLTDEYRIIIDRSVRDPETGFLNGIRLQVEARNMDRAAMLATELAASIKSKLQIRAAVEVLAENTLQRSTHKATRVIKVE
jgi:phenylacetate-CoA ligase